MSRQRDLIKSALVAGVVLFLLSTTGCVTMLKELTKTPGQQTEAGAPRKGEQRGKGRMTQVELQSHLMSFADRYMMIIGYVVDDFKQQQPTPRARLVVSGIVGGSAYSAFTIAAEGASDAVRPRIVSSCVAQGTQTRLLASSL